MRRNQPAYGNPGPRLSPQPGCDQAVVLTMVPTVPLVAVTLRWT